MEENLYSHDGIKDHLNSLKNELINAKSIRIETELEINKIIEKIRAQNLPYPIKKLREEIDQLNENIDYYCDHDPDDLEYYISVHEKFLGLFDRYSNYKKTIEFLYNYWRRGTDIKFNSKKQEEEEERFFFNLVCFIYHRKELVNELPMEFLDIIALHMEALVNMAIKAFKPSVLSSLIYITKTNKKLSELEIPIKSYKSYVDYTFKNRVNFHTHSYDNYINYIKLFNIHIYPKHPIYSYYDEILNNNKEEISKKIKEFVNDENFLNETPFRNINPEAISPYALFKLYIKKSIENLEIDSILSCEFGKHINQKIYMFLIQEIKDRHINTKSEKLFLLGCKEGSGLLLMDSFVLKSLWEHTTYFGGIDKFIGVAKKYVLDVEIPYEEFLESLEGAKNV